MEDENGVRLETLGQGAAVERFNLALQDALDNIQDVNTPAKTKRVATRKDAGMQRNMFLHSRSFLMSRPPHRHQQEKEKHTSS